ncbi:putative lipoxygenase 5 isoform X2 [Phalaenopsis equestris]|uniref:putative lipoxygenase 5 isoform X2 n=1 Tax=Phalaenopsis equestris TaxID=78828 RepID=UPI0009E5EC29|nr:putative lipoxygenase 5 isoform X2 [Phalaenopsis equestris]
MAAMRGSLSCHLLQRSALFPPSSDFLSGGDQSRLLNFLVLRQRKPVSVRAWKSPVTGTMIVDRPVVSALVEKEKPVKLKVKASVTIRRNKKQSMKEKMEAQLDAFGDRMGQNIVLELIGTEIDPRTKKVKTSREAILKDWFKNKDFKAEKVVYSADFMVDSSFGEPGAITVLNRHNKEFFLENIVVEGFACGPVHFTCDSWVQSIKDQPSKRIFFTNKPYLPSETPTGLRELRERELREVRGDGKGERKLSDRVYDFAVYNDLGNPDKGFQYMRPVFGGDERPYPRRCRTGRPQSDAESRVEYPTPVYVPRDETFEETKEEMLTEGNMKALLHNLMPAIVASIDPNSNDIKCFHEFDNLFKEGIKFKEGIEDNLLKKIPFVNKLRDSSSALLRYDTPHIITKDKFAWLRDDEFARQTLAGINPVNIERLQSFPPVSKLDPAIYGPPESAIKEEHIAGQLDGMTIKQAIEENRLFILNYHDIFLPFIDGINALDGRKAYATRTIFFLTSLGTLKPIAIELSLPQMTSRAKRVMTPPSDATSNWLWQLAKAHVIANDAGVHQLVNHWLRTHACIEPFIISTHRQLSIMHPIFKLLKPHMRYNLEINAIARQILISAGGVIESSFTPGPFSTEISSAFYAEHWRFDQESLPADLIRRGMAVEDRTKPHGLRLLIEDYPYANDGLLLWSALETFIKEYVATYYPSAAAVLADGELQSWYAEVITTGHGDHRNAPWWPALATPADLAHILTTLIWLASAQHAALNFGQYPLGAYIPCRPPLLRRLLPEEGDPDYDYFLADPHRYYLSAMPELTKATAFMTVIDTLSTHSADEEYLGERREGWTGDGRAVSVFKEFAGEIRRAEEEIERRNRDPAMRNRCGAGVLAYELMKPSSPPGITCRGVPNSCSI